MTNRKPVPQTMEDAVNALLASLRLADQQALRTVPVADLPERTWKLAAWIRNEFGLWDGSSPLLR